MSLPSTSGPRLGITTGDMDGIGLEITIKALLNLQHQLGQCRLTVFTHKNHQKQIETSGVADLEMVNFEFSETAPAQWIESVIAGCLNGNFQAMVNAPISKAEFARANFPDLGHTDMIRRMTKINNIFMAFLGTEFSCVLLTDHQPLASVAKAIDCDKILMGIQAAVELRKITAHKSKPIGLIGLNPHAGEGGLLGAEELQSYAQALQLAHKQGLQIKGPLPADSLFCNSSYKAYSVLIGAYHDQVLIPFKMVHGLAKGIQISLGLPFARTSVNHGSAKDLFGKNMADARSMENAIKTAYAQAVLHN